MKWKVRFWGGRLVIGAVGTLCCCATTVQAAAPDRPGSICYYPKFKGYRASTLRDQRVRTRVCLIRFAYVIASEGSGQLEPGEYAAAYCQQAYTYEEEMLSRLEHRPLNLDAASKRAASYARPWVQQGRRLHCLTSNER
jgi:hypothetical protein